MEGSMMDSSSPVRTRWHLNPDAPGPTSPWSDYTRVPPPVGLGTTISSTKQAMALTDDQHLSGTAYHEAGHAIAWSDCGVPIVSITRRSGGAAQAVVQLGPWEGPWEGYVVGFAAGHRAEIEWMHREGLLTPDREWSAERHSGGDREGADIVLRQCLDTPLTYGASTEHTDWSWMCDRADKVLAQRWGAVERLAVALVDQWGRGEPVMTTGTVRNLVEE